jgi:hypothetical protein
MEYSAHAKERMADRRISKEEVEEAAAAVYMTTPGHPTDRVNLWGKTKAGKRLRITVPRERRDFVITVAEVEESQ